MLLLSTAQQSESITHTHTSPPFSTSFPLRPPRSTGQSPWRCSGSASATDFTQRVSSVRAKPSLPVHPTPTAPLGDRKLVFYVRDYFWFAGKFTCTISLGSTYKQWYMASLSFWRTSLSITICRSIHPYHRKWHQFILCTAEWHPAVCAHICSGVGHAWETHFLILSSANRYLGCFHVQATVNNATSINPSKS